MQTKKQCLWAVILAISIFNTSVIHTYKLHPKIAFHKAQKHIQKIAKISYFNQGIASWYGPYFQGRQTASGPIFDTNKPMCAMRYVKFHTWVTIKNLATGKTAKCLILDRGPYRPYKGPTRIIDLSWAVAVKLNVHLAHVAVYY
jgi:rare lipoprotein A